MFNAVDDAVWTALADPHRRAVLERLRTRPRSVGELVSELGQSQPATSKHLRVLRSAGLVRVRAEAQRRIYAIDPGPMAELDAWIAPYRRLWNDSLDALERHLAAHPDLPGEDGPTTPQHDPSRDTGRGPTDQEDRWPRSTTSAATSRSTGAPPSVSSAASPTHRNACGRP